MRDKELQEKVDINYDRLTKNEDLDNAISLIAELVDRIDDLERQLNERGQYGIDWE